MEGTRFDYISPLNVIPSSSSKVRIGREHTKFTVYRQEIVVGNWDALKRSSMARDLQIFDSYSSALA